MGHKVKIGNEIKDIKGGKVLIGNEIKDIKGGKVLIGGVVKDIKFGTPLGERAVGSSIYMMVKNARTEFVVVNQGRPDTTNYDDSFDGTWIMARHIYAMSTDWINGTYADSGARAYLRGTFYNLLDERVQGKIKTVNLTSTESDKIFLPSTNELNLAGYDVLPPLSYFVPEGATQAELRERRIAYYNGMAVSWYLRNYALFSSDTPCSPYIINKDGTLSDMVTYDSKGIRPFMVLDPAETLIDDDGNIII